MTRLVTEWVSPMLDGMAEYNKTLKERTGVDLSGLAAEIFNASEEKMKTLRKEVLVGVVPITQGEGIIGDFAEAVAAIIASMGFRALVTEHTDVDGVYEGTSRPTGMRIASRLRITIPIIPIRRSWRIPSR